MRTSGGKRLDDHSRIARRERFGVFLLLLVLVAVGCGGDRDDRENIRNRVGEPDDIQYTEGPMSDWEIWTYYDTPVAGKNYEYRFERPSNACGGTGSWVLTFQREYTPAGSEEVVGVRSAPDVSDPTNPIKP
jgi:hypothetical protein